MTELTPEEINTLSKKDTLFKDLYKMLEEIRKEKLVSNVEKSEYIELTYNDLLEMNEFEFDSVYWDKIFESNKPKWDSKYLKINHQIDSIIDSYNERYERNKLENYLKIELHDVKTVHHLNNRRVDGVSLGFMLTPLKGTIQQVEYTPELVPKKDNDGDSVRDVSLSLLFTQNYSIPFSKPVVHYLDTNLFIYDELGGKSKDEVLKQYDVKIDIDRIRINNEDILLSTINVPPLIRYYNERNESDFSFSTELYKQRISEEYLNQDFQPLPWYNKSIKDSIINSNTTFKKINDLFDLYEIEIN